MFQYFGLLNYLVLSQLAKSGMGFGTLFFVGLVTSVHCIAMCGGINLSQSIPTDAQKKKSYGPALLYNLGRVASYTLMGLILGAVGYFIGGNEFGVPILVQSGFKIIAWILLVIMGIQMLGIVPALRKISLRLPYRAARAASKIALKSKTPILVGLLYGLMPCAPFRHGNQFLKSFNTIIYFFDTEGARGRPESPRILL
ncbi:MAG: sulfite exporter TauE/SafE family protein [Acutalibacteraceae bacterium]|nr:sulfite exporter TauE/SafE family protein [Acutalibacteraceae bacterium]